MGDFTEAIRQHKDAVLLDLFVTPNARHNVFPAGYNNWRKRIEIKIISEAKENKANKEVIRTLATYFQIAEKNVSIVRGDKSREKGIVIKHISTEEIIHKIRESLNGL
jgi:uncharacterized protein (TIGR00251 family)